ncbi:type VI secretion system lipoprotein TssJ [Simiduia sp. 21SJ11W-1]|uniref:type VI secretion system lipoprotein TssJ n=1 Tax=Simiduia sp. 21SJ11W-1 TaxID=2909669 RepID=UPI00209FA386|nr:type VI secretion system lipoprotein TssJ [Simiduia sp. 21SJ11W-1]UTA46615.1 type VI secretion system lipoprotein TssJ [Simiduia sp. 21SJ11W-1]
MQSSHLRRIAFFGAITLLLAACQATRETLNFDTSANVTLYAALDINPDQDKRASPLVIRVFKLADARQFGREDFLNLYEDAENRLGRDLLDTVVLKEIAPGEKRTETFELAPEVKYLGLLAEFVNYQDADAVTIIPIQPHTENDIDLQINGVKLIEGAPVKGRK